jgi:hypothetical protein
LTNQQTELNPNPKLKNATAEMFQKMQRWGLLRFLSDLGQSGLKIGSLTDFLPNHGLPWHVPKVHRSLFIFE